MTKGMPLREWRNKYPMDEENVTTARVFLIVGGILGFIIGALIF